MFESIRTGYQRLVPGGSNAPEPSTPPLPEDLGIFEDDESRAQRLLEEGGGDDDCFQYFCSRCDYQLSLQERLLGCATCMVCGYLLSFGSFLRMKDLMTGNPVPLVVNVTIGNVVALCGTCFLTGPKQQSTRMFHPKRRMASILYLSSLIVTLFLLVLPHHRGKGFILFLLLLSQYATITW